MQVYYSSGAPKLGGVVKVVHIKYTFWQVYPHILKSPPPFCEISARYALCAGSREQEVPFVADYSCNEVVCEIGFPKS